MSACARIPLWSRHMRNSPVATRAAMFHDLCGQIHTKPGELVESQHSFEGLAQFRRACTVSKGLHSFEGLACAARAINSPYRHLDGDQETEDDSCRVVQQRDALPLE